MKDLRLWKGTLWLIDALYLLVLVGLSAPQFAYLQFCLAFFLTLFSLIIAVIGERMRVERFLQGISLVMLAVTCLYAMSPQGPLSTFVYFVIGG